jgi:MFS transporter, PHS family, inorganic phosphate transporter
MGLRRRLGKLGGFVGVFVFPYRMHEKGLLGAESAPAITSVLRLVVTLTMLPETTGKSLEEIEAEAATPVEKIAA